MNKPTELIERAEAAMARLLLSATSVDRDVRIEADDAVKALIAKLRALTTDTTGD